MYDGFNDWKDVQGNFSMDEPEPDQVLLAVYDTPSYEGYALVIYRKDSKYFVSQGGHCSCYGLEGQWEPEEYTKEVLTAQLERLISSCYDTPKGIQQQYAAHVLAAMS